MLLLASCVQDMPALDSISVSEDHRAFEKGDDFIGERVTATYADGSTADVTNSAEYHGYDMQGDGLQTITVIYSEGGATVSTTYDITVHDPQYDWKKGLPKGVTVESFQWTFEGGNVCKGYKATVDFKANPYLKFNCVKTSGPKRTTSYQFEHLDKKRGTPALAVNAGYFGGTTSVSPVFSAGKVLQVAWGTFNWPNDEAGEAAIPLYAVRACLGQMEDGHFEIQWIYCTDKYKQTHTAYPNLDMIGNNEQTETFRPTPPTDSQTDFPGCFSWKPVEGVGAGPYLVRDGKNIAMDSYWKECLNSGGTSGQYYVNRTAAGITADGKLILVVCDGRGANGSAGVKLDQLADKFIEWGCTSAMNFDGGGSTTMVKYKTDTATGGRTDQVQVINHPSDASGERPVVSCIVISEKRG